MRHLRREEEEREERAGHISADLSYRDRDYLVLLIEKRNIFNMTLTFISHFNNKNVSKNNSILYIYFATTSPVEVKGPALVCCGRSSQIAT